MKEREEIVVVEELERRGGDVVVARLEAGPRVGRLGAGRRERESVLPVRPRVRESEFVERGEGGVEAEVEAEVEVEVERAERLREERIW